MKLQMITLLMFLLPSVPILSKGAANVNERSCLCKGAALPSEVKARLKEEFGSWKVQEPQELSAPARERWRSEKPLGCPGVAVGRFAGGTTLSYAVLLVPREHSDAGYKFLIFNPTPGGSSYETTVVEQSDQGGAANFFIHRVQISKFFDDASRKKFGAGASEGILLADAGAKEYETDVYFWTNGSYQHQPVDY